MERHTKTVTLVLVLALVYFAARTAMGWWETRKVLSLQLPDKVGLNEDLLAKVDSLEEDIARRSNYQVELIRDPLKLSSVMNVRERGAAALEFIEKHRQMRLSCTIISPHKKTAVIKYRSKSFVVAVGDTLSDHRIVSIDKKTVTMEHGGKEVILTNRPAPAAEARQTGGPALEEIAL